MAPSDFQGCKSEAQVMLDLLYRVPQDHNRRSIHRGTGEEKRGEVYRHRSETNAVPSPFAKT